MLRIYCRGGAGEHGILPHFPAADRSAATRRRVLRRSILAMLALILGSVLVYDLVRPRLTSPSTPFPRPRPSAGGAAPVLATYPG
jgi:hypothetical protein